MKEKEADTSWEIERESEKCAKKKRQWKQNEEEWGADGKGDEAS